MMTQETARQTLHQVYKLVQDTSHLVGDLKYDAWLAESIEYENINILGTFWESTQLNLPARIEFDCDGERLLVSDYPYVKERWPIMSRRMLEAFLTVREFPHQVIPVVMKDIFVPPQFEENHDFVAVQLLEHQDVFDWEKSIYERDPDYPESVDPLSIEKLVLREPKTGFPPIFRVKELETVLYVSSAGRTALEMAGIRGVEFVELRGSWLP
jgi:hypothetical protein